MALERILLKAGWKTQRIITSSREAPPLLVQQVNYWGWFSVSTRLPKVVKRVWRFLIYRFARLLSPIWEYFADKRLIGAELIVIAQKASSEVEEIN